MNQLKKGDFIRFRGPASGVAINGMVLRIENDGSIMYVRDNLTRNSFFPIGRSCPVEETILSMSPTIITKDEFIKRVTRVAEKSSQYPSIKTIGDILDAYLDNPDIDFMEILKISANKITTNNIKSIYDRPANPPDWTKKHMGEHVEPSFKKRIKLFGFTITVTKGGGWKQPSFSEVLKFLGKPLKNSGHKEDKWGENIISNNKNT